MKHRNGKISLNIRFDLEHLARIENALSELGHFPQNYSDLIRDATIAFMNYQNPDWTKLPLTQRSLDRIVSFSGRGKAKGQSSLMSKSELINVTQNTARPEIVQSSLDSIIQNSPDTTGSSLTHTQIHLAPLKFHRAAIMAEMPDHLKDATKNLWVYFLDGLDTLSNALKPDPNDNRARHISAVIINNLYQHDQEIIEPEFLPDARVAYKEAIEATRAISNDMVKFTMPDGITNSNETNLIRIHQTEILSNIPAHLQSEAKNLMPQLLSGGETMISLITSGNEAHIAITALIINTLLPHDPTIVDEETKSIVRKLLAMP